MRQSCAGVGGKDKLEEQRVCPIRYALKRVGDQWSMLVLYCLTTGTMRFGEMQKQIGTISARVLTQTLRNLEQDGLLTRKAYPTIPPRVEYTLTDLGRSLASSLDSLFVWAEENYERVREAQASYRKTEVSQ